MPNKSMPSLRTQVIDAMNAHAKAQGWADRTPAFNADMFEQAIMPVLQKAMDAGALLLSRNTGPRLTSNEAVKKWLQQFGTLMVRIDAQHPTLSKRDLLRVLDSLAREAHNALVDMEAGR